MTVARLWLAPVGETMFPHAPRPEFALANSGLAKAERAPFFFEKRGETSRFPRTLSTGHEPILGS